MKRGMKALFIVLAALALIVGIIAGVAMSWYNSAVPKIPTSTPLPKANLPWSDDFSDSASGWHTEIDAGAEVGYQDGVLRIFVHDPNLLAWAFGGHEFSDFHLSVDATQVAGPQDNEYGTLVRIQDRDHLYRFSISGDGYYQVTKHGDEGWELMTAEWIQTDAIHVGAEKTNHLEVICQGPLMTFIVTGQQLTQVQDEDYVGGDIGLYAGAFYEAGVEVHFDNVSITEP